MKIWWHHPLTYKEVYKTYDEILKKHTDMLSENGKLMTVDHYWNKKGTSAIPYHSLDLMNKGQVVDAMMRAEEAGYDAAVVGCSMDDGLIESKEAVKIPLVGLAESGMIAACLLGKNFAEITFGKKLKSRIEERAAELGLSNRLVTVRVIDMDLEEAAQALTDVKFTKVLTDLFVKESKKAIDDYGAEVIIPGCGLLCTLCIRDRIGEIEGTGVPVVDGVISALGLVRTLYTLQKKAGVTVNRSGSFAAPPAELLKEARKYYV